MKHITKKAAGLLTAAAMLLCLSACGDGPIMRVVSQEKTVEQKDLLPREGEQRCASLATATPVRSTAELPALQKLVEEKYAAVEAAAKKAYLTDSRYYAVLARQLKNDCQVTIGGTIAALAEYETSGTPAVGAGAGAPAMTKDEYARTLSDTREALLELWGELDDIEARFNDYMTIMNALVNLNGVFGLIKNIEEKTWEGSFPKGYVFNDDSPAGSPISLFLDGSAYVRQFGVADAQLYALGYKDAGTEDTMELIDAMRAKGVLTSVLTDEEDGLQWYGSWIDTGGRACYYFVWYKEGGLGNIVESFIGQSVERIIVAGSFDFMTCVLAALNG